MSDAATLTFDAARHRRLPAAAYPRLMRVASAHHGRVRPRRQPDSMAPGLNPHDATSRSNGHNTNAVYLLATYKLGTAGR